jgi:hypothetical protein
MSLPAGTHRYSQKQKDIGEAKNFSWEYPVPINAFWDPLDFLIGRNFLQCFSADEISQLPLDDSLSKDGKLELLLKLLQDELASEDKAAAPQTLYDVDFPAWDKLLLAIHTMQLRLKRLDSAESTLRELIDRRKDPTNLCHLHSLSCLLEQRGDYMGAEQTERLVKVWLDGKLGNDSPQSLGSRRIIARNLWRQGGEKRGEARRGIEEVRGLIEGSGGGRYAVYRDEQKRITEEIVKGMEGWEET